MGATAMSKKGLGRGLSALLGDDVRLETVKDAPEAFAQAQPQMLAIELLVANPDQPRRNFDETALAELAESVAAQGIVQPILVRPIPQDPGLYEIVAGERRWRAAQLARLHQIPVVVRELTDEQALEIAIVENVQRADLTPIEEARAYQRLAEELGRSQEEVAEVVGKSRSHVANMIRLLALPEAVQKMLEEGALSMGHARALITAKDPTKVAKIVVEKGLSVRQTEEVMQRLKNRKAGGASAGAAKDPETQALEADLSQALGLKVTISHKAKGGVVKISYKNLDQLDDLCQRMCQFPSDRGEPQIRGL